MLFGVEASIVIKTLAVAAAKKKKTKLFTWKTTVIRIYEIRAEKRLDGGRQSIKK